ncbi:MAG: stimulus-sensing domain-containing protein [Rhodospirillaceae bacterium]
MRVDPIPDWPPVDPDPTRKADDSALDRDLASAPDPVERDCGVPSLRAHREAHRKRLAERDRRAGGRAGRRLRARRFGLIASPLVRRILAVNLIAPVLLAFGFLYLDTYEETLTDSAFQALRTEAELIAAAVGEGAINLEVSVEGPVVRARHGINTDMAGQMVRRLSDLAQVRARLFSGDGALVADSRRLLSFGGIVQVQDLPPPDMGQGVGGWIRQLYNEFFLESTAVRNLPPYQERARQHATDYDEVALALKDGIPYVALRSQGGLGRHLSVAVPVQYYKQVVGAVMVSRGGEEIDTALFEMRLAIVEIFGVVLALTILLSFYMGGTIARPILRLALATDRIRAMGRGKGDPETIKSTLPDLSHRGDEVGDLSQALREMTEALWGRMDAIERFAADVAHEIKNPLTSLRSAVETAARIQDPDRRERLMAVILDDVQRLDRLISDISDASRLDAELSRAEPEPVALAPMLETLAEIHQVQAEDEEAGVKIVVRIPKDDPLTVVGLEGRLVQVLRNLITNALSFSPEGGEIRLTARRIDPREDERGGIRITVEDDGPGIPEGKEEDIFNRFYSERPQGEKFGTHSGLGLSISRQIIESHLGTLQAENRRDPGEWAKVIGARFLIILPEAPEE